MTISKVLLAAPQFCAGVEMAIKALTWMVEPFRTGVLLPRNCAQQIVVERFESLGVIFIDDIDEVPVGAPVMLSAHGSAPDVVTKATGWRLCR